MYQISDITSQNKVSDITHQQTRYKFELKWIVLKFARIYCYVWPGACTYMTQLRRYCAVAPNKYEANTDEYTGVDYSRNDTIAGVYIPVRALKDMKRVVTSSHALHFGTATSRELALYAKVLAENIHEVHSKSRCPSLIEVDSVTAIALSVLSRQIWVMDSNHVRS